MQEEGIIPENCYYAFKNFIIKERSSRICRIQYVYAMWKNIMEMETM